MAQGGRPVERPAHLSPTQRGRAQQRTREWRQESGLSQKEMAREIGVSYSTYRPWENGKDGHAGPTHLQAAQLNKALRRLLPDRYVDGEAFDVWGWPQERDMSYGQVAGLLRSAGFDVPFLLAGARPPAKVFWVHRVREPNLVHGVFSLAAAAATRAGLPVHLLLDDISLIADGRRLEMCRDIESRVRRWVEFASGNDAKLTTGLYSTVLTEEYLTQRGWPAVNGYLNSHSSVLEFLLASKAVSPLQYNADAEEGVLALLRNAESLYADRLLTPLRNWMVFEAEIARMLDASPAGSSDTIITLGGEDERILWQMWHRGCSDRLSARVQHLFLSPMPIPSHQTWDEPALSVRTNRPSLTAYLQKSMAPDGTSDLVEWLLRSAILLPAALNPGFADGLDPALSDVNVLLRAHAGELPRAVGAVAKAIVEWLNT